ncbi:hypothetical protein AB0C38_37280 [Amycolatopsis sp. NPDC048633]|uniref:hypothetical protein n=1 Tax=Amycolatopsis sp. NPDC048633 TaxID=3157095 RepID=UPI0033D5AEE9
MTDPLRSGQWKQIHFRESRGIRDMNTLGENPEIVKFVYWDNLTYSPPGSRAPEEWDPALGVQLYESCTTRSSSPSSSP